LKALVNVLCIISVIAVALIIALFFPIFFGNDERIAFICFWFLWILFIPSIPASFSFWLIWKKNKLSPPIWLTIYSVSAIMIIIIGLIAGFVDMTRDLPLAFQENYYSTEGENVFYHDGKLNVDDKKLTIRKEKFGDIEYGEKYCVLYLSNTKFVIDILNENGASLSKIRR